MNNINLVGKRFFVYVDDYYLSASGRHVYHVRDEDFVIGQCRMILDDDKKISEENQDYNHDYFDAIGDDSLLDAFFDKYEFPEAAQFFPVEVALKDGVWVSIEDPEEYVYQPTDESIFKAISLRKWEIEYGEVIDGKFIPAE